MYEFLAMNVDLLLLFFADQAIKDCSMNEQAGKAGRDDDWIHINDTQRHTSVDECKKYCIRTEACVAVHYIPLPKHCFVYNRTTTLISVDDSIYSLKNCVDSQSR